MSQKSPLENHQSFQVECHKRSTLRFISLALKLEVGFFLRLKENFPQKTREKNAKKGKMKNYFALLQLFFHCTFALLSFFSAPFCCFADFKILQIFSISISVCEDQEEARKKASDVVLCFSTQT